MIDFKLGGVRVRATHEAVWLERPTRKAAKFGVDGPIGVYLSQLLGVVDERNGKWTTPDSVRFIVRPDQFMALAESDPWNVSYPNTDAGTKQLRAMLEWLEQNGTPVGREDAVRQALGIAPATRSEASDSPSHAEKRRREIIAKVPQIEDRLDIVNAAVEGLQTLMGVKRELRALPERLSPGEKVIALSDGTYKVDDRVHSGLLILTDRRLVFFAEGLLSGQTESFALGAITSVQVTRKLLFKSLHVSASGNTTTFGSVGQADNIAAKLREAQLQPSGRSAAPASSVSSAAASGIRDRILQLQALHDDGLISLEEFEAKRQKLLDDL